MHKKYILIAIPLDTSNKKSFSIRNILNFENISDDENIIKYENIIESIMGGYFKKTDNYDKKNPYLISKDGKIKLIFIIIHNCKDIYNSITFNEKFHTKHKQLLYKKTFDLIITVVKDNCFSEFFYKNWKSLNIKDKIPVISVNSRNNSNNYYSQYSYNEENRIIKTSLSKEKNGNIFSQLVYSLLVKPEIIIYSSFPNKQLSLIEKLCNKFFPYTTINIVRPNKNNQLSPLEEIKSAKNKIILFILDDELIKLNNLNFFMDLLYTETDHCLMFCASKTIEDKVTDTLFSDEIKRCIQEKKQKYQNYSGTININEHLENLNFLLSSTNKIHTLLKKSEFYGSPNNTHKEILYQLERKLYREFLSIGIISGIYDERSIKNLIDNILNKKIKDNTSLNEYIAARDIIFVNKGDVNISHSHS